MLEYAQISSNIILTNKCTDNSDLDGGQRMKILKIRKKNSNPNLGQKKKKINF